MGENPGFLRRYFAGIFSRRQKAMNKFVAEMRLRRHADDDILSPTVRADLDALIDEARIAPDVPHNLYSFTKSFTSTAVGMAIDLARIRLLERPVMRWIRGHWGVLMLEADAILNCTQPPNSHPPC